jgi:hypothetical protein
MERNRQWRRDTTQKKVEQRVKMWARNGWKNLDERHVGMMRKTNFSCGCIMCKPWKHGKKR